jgi:hypothetical protein
MDERFAGPRKVVAPVEPVDDVRFLRNYNTPDRDFRTTTASDEPKPKATPRFFGAACRDTDL